MKKKITIFLGIGVIVALLIEVAVLKYQLKQIQLHPCINFSFYANILKSTPHYLLVEGTPVNDINHQGQFEVSLKEKDPKGIVLDLFGNEIDFTQLAVGDSVLIVYNGPVLETHPGRIHGAVLIRIVE